MEQRLALVGKARSPVGHHTFALGGAHGHAQVCFARCAEQTLAALGGIERNHMVTGLDTGDPFAQGHNDARTFMTQHGWEKPFGVFAREREGVCVADTGVRDLDQHLALAWRLDIDLDDLQRFACLEGDGCTRFHKSSIGLNFMRRQSVSLQSWPLFDVDKQDLTCIRSVIECSKKKFKRTSRSIQAKDFGQQ